MNSSEKHTSNTAPGSETPWVGTTLIALSAAGFASLTLLGKVAIELNLSLLTVLGLRFLGAALILDRGSSYYDALYVRPNTSEPQFDSQIRGFIITQCPNGVSC